MLKNAFSLAKIGADTTENERNSAKKLATILPSPVAGRGGRRRRRPDRLGRGGRAPERNLYEQIWQNYQKKNWKFLAGSFSAVSKGTFENKYAFHNIFHALQDVHTSAPLQTQHFGKT